MNLKSWMTIAIGWTIFPQVSYVDASSSYHSDNSPSFYKNERGLFNCSFDTSDLTDRQFAAVSSFGLRARYTGGSDVYLPQCEVDRSVVNRPEIKSLPSASVTTAQCQAALSATDKNFVGDNLLVPFTMTEIGDYFCTLTHIQNSKSHHYVAWVTKLYVAPTSLTLTTTPKSPFIIGHAVEVVCRSEGGDPADGDLRIAINEEPLLESTFIPSSKHHNAILSCRNMDHSHYQRGNSPVTYQELRLEVYHLIAYEEIVNETQFSNSSIDLNCLTTSYLPFDQPLIYNWSRNGVKESVENSSWTIDYQFGKNSEIIECTVTSPSGLVEPATINFQVKWLSVSKPEEMDITTTPTTTIITSPFATTTTWTPTAATTTSTTTVPTTTTTTKLTRMLDTMTTTTKLTTATQKTSTSEPPKTTLVTTRFAIKQTTPPPVASSTAQKASHSKISIATLAKTFPLQTTVQRPDPIESKTTSENRPIPKTAQAKSGANFVSFKKFYFFLLVIRLYIF